MQGFSITRVEKPDGGFLSFTNYFVRNYVSSEMFLFIMHVVFLYHDARKERNDCCGSMEISCKAMCRYVQ